MIPPETDVALEAFVEHRVSLVLGHTLDFSWLDVSQTDVFHFICSSPIDRNQLRSVRGLPVTVSSIEAQHILI